MEFLFNMYLIQSHPLSCARLKISSASTTPPLNTTLFLWLQISDTIATYKPFHTELTLLLWPIRWKLWKLVFFFLLSTTTEEMECQWVYFPSCIYNFPSLYNMGLNIINDSGNFIVKDWRKGKFWFKKLIKHGH